MDDLRRRFASLDRVPVPDLWDTIETRAAALDRVERVTTFVTPVSLRSRRSNRPSPMLLAATVALLVALVAGAVAIGSGLIKLPATVPDPLSLVGPTPTAIPEPQLGLVAYRESGRIRVVAADGTDDRQLVPFALDPEKPRYLGAPDEQYPLAWSADGSRLYYRFGRVESRGPNDGIGQGHGGLAMTDAAGSKPVDLFDLSTADRSDPWCPVVVEDDNCQANVDGAVISPDASRLAYVIMEGSQLTASTIVILDVSTARITPLESTRTQNPDIDNPCSTEAFQGYNESPSWSPDGSRLIFTRQSLGPSVNGFCQSTSFTVNADGSDLRQLLPLDTFGLIAHPRWSPDGSVILFHSKPYPPDPEDLTVDIHTVGVDGTGLKTLTTDGVSAYPEWTRDGRIVFVRWTAPAQAIGDLWVMDNDGGNATQIESTVPALTAIRCAVCPFPASPNRYWTSPDRLNVRLWQPTPASG
jgi:hypothetical protein